MTLCLIDMSTTFDTIDHDTFFQGLSERMGIYGKVLVMVINVMYMYLLVDSLSVPLTFSGYLGVVI